MTTATLLRRNRPIRSVRSSLGSTGSARGVRVVEPFHVTFFKVGSTIFALCAVTYFVLVHSSLNQQGGDDNGVPYREHLLVKHNHVRKDSKESKKVTTLPTFTLTAASEHDVFGFAQRHLSNVNDDTAPNEILQFLKAAEKLRMDFSDRYGGEVCARSLLERSLKVLRKNESEATCSHAMAFRLQQAREQRGVFIVTFGGNEAVAGYGNFFHHSFSFVMESLLKEALEDLGLTLQVLNGSVKQISPFPYTWCRRNHMGEHADVSGIDFGAIPANQLEQVLRNIVGPSQESPILVYRDSLKIPNERLDLLQSYVNAQVIVNPIIVDLQAAFAPFANVRETHLPPGFQQWEEFGAPPGAPGKVRRNLTVKQHELYGWLLAMHVLHGAEVLVASILKGSDAPVLHATNTSNVLARPMLASKTLKTTTSTALLYGIPRDRSYKEWTMPSMECRSAFHPVVSGALEGAVIGGTAGDGVDLLHPKGAMYLSQGWVLDLDAAERREKQLMKQWDNLGFQDYQKAYYGVAASGPLSLFLPIGDIGESNIARDRLNCLIVCQSNVKRDGNSCNLQSDVSFTVGGVLTSSVQWISDDSVAYHGKRLCVLIDVPEDAALMPEDDVRQIVVNRTQAKFPATSGNQQTRGLPNAKVVIGVSVEINVTNSLVTWHKGACSIAQLIWGPSTSNTAR